MNRCRKITVFALVIITITMFINSSIRAVSFDSVFDCIKQMRTSEDFRMKVHVTSQHFTLLQSRIREIECSDLEKLLEKHDSQVPSQFKILRGNNLVLQYDLERNGILEKTFKGDKLESCTYIEYYPIETYSLDYWPRFIQEAVLNGLMSYNIFEDANGIYAVLTFSPLGPSKIIMSGGSIHFTEEVYDYLRINKEYKYWAGNNGFAILIHEPHWCVTEQYKLINGLKHFIESNTDYKFRFLVEGNYSEDTKYISTAPLLNILSEDVPIPPQVFSLVRYALIDGPLAYRLIYNPNIPALAIDNPYEISNTPEEKHDKYLFASVERLENTFLKLNKYQNESAKDLKLITFILLRYLRADKSELKGQNLIDYQSMIAELFGSLSESLELFDRSAFSSEILEFNKESEAYKTDNIRYYCALHRDRTMADNISLHFESSYKDHIPIVFIGNFHTPAIISHLKSKGIGYLVLEPRTSMITPTQNIKNFRMALNKGTRQHYLKEISSRLKLPVAPTKDELIYYEKFISKVESPKIIHRKTSLEQAHATLSDCKVEFESLCQVLESNGYLCSSNVVFSGGGSEPPSNLSGAFAAYSYEPESDESKLILFDSKNDKWTNPARYRSIKHFMSEPPLDRFSQHTREVWFYNDKDSGIMFANIFDPITQCIYLFDGEEADIFNLLPLPKAKDEKGILIHMQIGFWRKKQNEEKRKHG